MIDTPEQDIRLVPSKNIQVKSFQPRKPELRIFRPYQIYRKKNLQDQSGQPDFTRWIMPPQPQRYIKGMDHDYL